MDKNEFIDLITEEVNLAIEEDFLAEEAQVVIKKHTMPIWIKCLKNTK